MATHERSTVDVRTVGRVLVRISWRATITVVGFTLVALGLAGLLLPILPGWVLIIGGFAVLSREYSWAHSALVFCRRQAVRSGAGLRSLADRRRRVTVVDVSEDPVVVDLTEPRAARLEESEQTA
jgi:uncharacterized protein (TIGR02611 family)